MRAKRPDTFFFGGTPIEDIPISVKCRDGVPKILRALQELYKNKEYRERVFAILEKKILGGKKETGRPGMGLWEIFVLAQVRFGDNLDYDKLHHLANHDKLMRGIMGVEGEAGFGQKQYDYKTLIDNVSLLDDESLDELNGVIVEMGHDVFKKKEAEPLSLKSDSYVCESSVHFPTDYNLLWDSLRKSLDILLWFVLNCGLASWRKHNSWRKTLKRLYRSVSRASRGGGANKEKRLSAAVESYLDVSRSFLEKLKETKFPIMDMLGGLKLRELVYYREMVDKHMDLLERRVLKGERIPHGEKLFSIFEPYTEWINKGKFRPSVELGKRVLLTSDQFGLIVDWQVLDGLSDVATLIPLVDRVVLKHEVLSWSFDKGFWSKENYEHLSSKVDLAVLPKKGRRSAEERKRELGQEFKEARRQHSAVESSVNEFEKKGPGRCPDKGYDHFKRYVSLGVISHNLHRIGEALRRRELEKERSNARRRAA